MKVSLSTVKFRSDIGKGREEFNKLSKTEQAGRVGAEMARQHYNETHFPPLEKSKGNIGEYLRYRVSINKALKNVLEKFKFKK